MNRTIEWSAWRRIVVLGLVGFSAALASESAAAQELPFTGVVVEDNAQLHSGPGRTYVTGSARKDALVRVEQATQGWYKIVPPEGSYSFVSKVWVDAQGNGQTGTTNHNHVAVKAVNLEDRGYSYRTQMSLSKGQTVQILGEYGGYYMIAPPAGAFVYIPTTAVRRATQAEIDAVSQAAVAEPAKPAEPATPAADVSPAQPEASVTSEVKVLPEPQPAVKPAEEPKAETPASVTPPAPQTATPPAEPVVAAPATPAAPSPEAVAEVGTDATLVIPAVAPAVTPADEAAATAELETAVADAVAAVEAAPVEAAADAATAAAIDVAEPAVEPVAPAPPPLYTYDEAEFHFKSIINRPVEEGVEPRLIQSFEALTQDTSLTPAQRSWARSRLDPLRRRAVIADALTQIKIARETPAKPVVLTDVPTSPQPMMRPDAIGWLLASSVYNGERLPRLYRLVDPQNQRTLAYVKPGPEIQEKQLLGKLLAVRGQTRTDTTLNVPVLDVKDIRVVQTAN